MLKRKAFSVLCETLFCLGMLAVWFDGVFAQISNPDVDREVIVMLEPGAMELPESVSEATPEGLATALPAVRGILLQHQVDRIRKGFPDFNQADTLRVLADGRLVSSMNLSRVFVLRVQGNQNRDSLITQLRRLPQVLYAEPNSQVRPRAIIPDDTHFGLQWNLRNTGQSGGTPGADIKATDAWDIFQGSSSVRIGIVDVGRVQNTHPEFSNRMSGNFNTSISSHATHVAGIAGAKGGNNAGIAGVDWNAQINTQTITSDILDMANAVRAAVDAGSHITNNSWGQGSNTFSVTLKQAFAYAYKHNVASVIAMSATYSPEDYPNAYGAGIVNVAGTTDRDAATSYTVQRNYVDVAAPGGDQNSGRIYSTIPTNTYGHMYGTSMAAPHVAGIASLMRGYAANILGKTLYNDDIENIIKLSADDVNSAQYPGWDQYLGYGRVNARKALDRLGSAYTLTQSFTVGGTDQGASGGYWMTIYGAQSLGLQDGSYWVKRHEVRKSVTYANTQGVAVWGRGAVTNGWANEPVVGSSYYNFAYGFCEPVPGTVTSTGATLRTYVYEVFTSSDGSGFLG